MNAPVLHVAGTAALPATTISAVDFPLDAALSAQACCLAIIAGVEGPSYRRVGAAMVVDAGGRHWGTLSSGCLERDVVAHALLALQSGQPSSLRYGRGSPYLDIALPCGGSLDIALVPHPDRAALADAAACLQGREAAELVLTAAGTISTGGEGLAIRLLPQTRFMVAGAGPEAAIFASLVQAAGYPVDLASPDGDTLAAAGFGSDMTGAGWPFPTPPDPYTAVTLFFHDHEREQPILREALASPAFYVGAQGSLRAHRTRVEALLAGGLGPAQVDRLASPFGLIPSTRDARTLAVSVLAHVLASAPDAPPARMEG